MTPTAKPYDLVTDGTALDVAETALAKSHDGLGGKAERVHLNVAAVTCWAPPHLFDLCPDRALQPLRELGGGVSPSPPATSFLRRLGCGILTS